LFVADEDLLELGADHAGGEAQLIEAWADVLLALTGDTILEEKGGELGGVLLFSGDGEVALAHDQLEVTFRLFFGQRHGKVLVGFARIMGSSSAFGWVSDAAGACCECASAC